MNSYTPKSQENFNLIAVRKKKNITYLEILKHFRDEKLIFKGFQDIADKKNCTRRSYLCR